MEDANLPPRPGGLATVPEPSAIPRGADTGPVPRGVGRRVGWGLADQALSSATNFALAIVVARTVDARAFGAFGLAFAAYILAVGTSRAVVNEPLAIRFSSKSKTEQRRACGQAVGAALTFGVVGGAITSAAAMLVGGPTRGTLLAFSVCLPGLLMQDAWRSAFLTLGHPKRAFLNDLVWAALQAGGMAVVLRGDPTPGVLVAVWGGAAAVAAIAGSLQAGLPPVLGALSGWLHHHRDLWPRLSTEFWVMTGMWQLTIFAVGALAGLEAVGSIRGAQTLLGPLNLFFLAVPLVLLPEAARLYAEHPTRLVNMSAMVGAALAALAVLAGVAALLVPGDLGRQLLGPTWEGTRVVLLPTALFLASTGANLGALLGLRAKGATDASLRARLVVSPVVVIGGLTGGAAGGAVGAATGLAVANWVATIVWWRALRSAVRRQEP